MLSRSVNIICIDRIQKSISHQLNKAEKISSYCEIRRIFIGENGEGASGGFITEIQGRVSKLSKKSKA